MREILHDAIEDLRPAGFRPIDEDVNVRNKEELQYIILTERHLYGRRRDYLESVLGLPQRTYYNHEQEALLSLGEKLREWEYTIIDQEQGAVTSTNLTWELLQQATKSESEHQMERIREGKYNPRLYLKRNDFLSTFREFLESDSTCFVLAGKSEVGKTSFLLSLLDHYADNPGVSILLYDASHLVIRDSLLQKVCADLCLHMGLSGESSVSLLTEAGRQIDMNGRSLVVAFDAINEHPNAREHIVAIDQMVGEARWPWLKMVVSTRPHAWQILTSGLSLAEERYCSQLFVQSRLIRPRESLIHLDRFSYAELDGVYGKYRDVYGIETAYEDISFDIRREICDPLIKGLNHCLRQWNQ